MRSKLNVMLLMVSFPCTRTTAPLMKLYNVLSLSLLFLAGRTLCRVENAMVVTVRFPPSGMKIAADESTPSVSLYELLTTVWRSWMISVPVTKDVSPCRDPTITSKEPSKDALTFLVVLPSFKRSQTLMVELDTRTVEALRKFWEVKR